MGRRFSEGVCEFEFGDVSPTCRAPDLDLDPDLRRVADKNQLVNEFLSQIKWNTELKAMYESVQKDSSTAAAATTTASEMSLMDVSV